MIVIPQLLDADRVREMRMRLDAAEWIDGNATSGHQSALAKHNRQLSEDSDEARTVGDLILDALAASPLFVAAALPLSLPAPVQPLRGR